MSTVTRRARISKFRRRKKADRIKAIHADNPYQKRTSSGTSVTEDT